VRRLMIVGIGLAAFLAACSGPQRVQPQFEPVQEIATSVSALNTGAAEMVDETPTAWLVELSGRPKIEGGSDASVKADKDNFRALARANGVKFRERFEYSELWNGLSVEASASEAAKLRGIPGVKAVWPVLTVSAPQPVDGGSETDMFTAITQTQVNIAQNTLGLNGRGVKVGIIDTGIDLEHPDFAGRIRYGFDFVGDAYNAADPNNSTPIPQPGPGTRPGGDDCNGHGTHVAGITGANGTVKGVAPEVTLGAYRVFGCEGSSSADVIIAALEKAYKDGMDVVNMSLGAAFQWPQYPTAVVSNRLVKKGVVVVASAGNSGANGAYSLGAPGVGEDVIGVASYDNVAVFLNFFTISPDNQAIGYGPATGAPTPPTSGSLPMARTGTPAATSDACNPLPAGSLAGQAALIRRGGCTFYQKAFNAQQAGAAAVVLYNNAPGRFSPTVAGTPAITIPVVAISDTEGVLINNRLATGPVTLTWTNQSGSFPNPTGNLISSFSSIGLSPDLTLKPDLGAPGGLIYSTYPLEKGAFATLSGTSMSSPHVAGVVALYLQAKPGTPASEMRTILQNTSDPKRLSVAPTTGLLDIVHRQGAGMVQIVDAINSTTRVTPGKLSLGEVESGSVTRTLTIRNLGNDSETYTFSHVAAPATTGTFTVSYFNAPSLVSFSSPSVTVAPGSSASVNVTITPNTGLANLAQFGGYVVVRNSEGATVARVPYAGFKGDYQGIQALAPTTFGFPWLARLVGTNYVRQTGPSTFTLQGGDIPYFLVHLDHPVAKLQFEVLNASNNRPVHPVFNKFVDLEYVGRNSTATGFFAFAWDGTRIHSNMDNGNGDNSLFKTVPNGSYVVRIRALKALGNENNPAHWESWNSPVITLARP
jgi:minor extracellular serine protease Vpr